MKFTTTTRTLMDALDAAKAVIPTNPATVAYGSVMIHVKKNVVAVVGSDGDTTVSTSLTATATVNGTVFLTPGPLYAFLRGAGDRPVTVRVDGDVLVDVDGLATYRFRPVTATFPLPGGAKGSVRPFSAPGLRNAVDAVRHAAGKDLGILVSSHDGDLTLYATDHYRLHAAHLPGQGFGDFDGAFPVNVLHQICDLAATEVVVDERSRSLTFRQATSFITTRTLAGDYPRVAEVTHQHCDVTGIADRTSMLSALVRLGSVSDGDPVEVRTKNGQLVMTVDNPERGAGSEHVACRGGDDIVFLADRTFLVDALHAHGDGDVELGWSSSVGPVFMRSATSHEVTTVIMPIRSS